MKNSKQFFAILVIMILSSFMINNISFSQTHIPPGDVSGTWTIDGSPYIVDGDVTIPIDSTLIIEPGVSVIFSTLGFEILGRLLAEGTYNDSITFTVADTANRTALGFYDLDITDQDSSLVSYSKYEYIGVYFNQSSKAKIENSIINKRRIYFYNSSAIIKNVIVRNNTSTSYGGGICCTQSSSPRLVNVTVVGNNPGGIWCSYDSDPIIENSNITDNIGAGICCTYSSSPSLYYVTISGNSGGGITCSNNSNIILENVKICDNSVWGGIYSDGSTPTLTNVTIIGNSTDECGGGISLGGGGVVTLRNVKIIGNTSGYDGGGIYAAYGDQVVMLINVLVANNYAWNSGGGINIIDVPFFMAENVTVCDNSTDGLGGGIMCQLESDAVIKNSIVWNNSGGEIVEYWTGGDAVAVYYSDVRGGWSGPGSHNINSDPLFSDDDYRLSEDSPCIDTGSADTTGLHLPPWDLDGNVRIWDGNGDGVAVIDMGVYEYGAPVYSVNEPEIPEQSTIHNYPNPFTTSTTISFYRTPNIHEEAQIEIYNLKGQKIKTLTDNQIMKGGNHEIMWDGTNSRNKRVGSGIYFIKLRTEKSINVKKIVKFGL